MKPTLPRLSLLLLFLLPLGPGCGGTEAEQAPIAESDGAGALQSTEQAIMVCDTTWRRVSPVCCGSLSTPKTLWRRAVYDGPTKCKVEYWCRPQSYACAY